jgi:hypothetical protein
MHLQATAPMLPVVCFNASVHNAVSAARDECGYVRAVSMHGRQYEDC